LNDEFSRRTGVVRRAFGLAFAADTLSITVMEVVDNGIMLAVPGAMEAPLDSPLFWGSLLGALLIAGLVVFPLNRWLIGRGQGHAIVHAHHGGSEHDSGTPAQPRRATNADTGHSHH
jgi:hypothetical protein